MHCCLRAARVREADRRDPEAGADWRYATSEHFCQRHAREVGVHLAVSVLRHSVS